MALILERIAVGLLPSGVFWVGRSPPFRPFVFLIISAPYADAIRALMSSTRHMVQRPSFTGLGKRPVLTPSHQQDFFTGMIGGIGGFALGSPMMCGSRRNPVSGRWFMCSRPFFMNYDGLHRIGTDKVCPLVASTRIFGCFLRLDFWVFPATGDRGQSVSPR